MQNVASSIKRAFNVNPKQSKEQAIAERSNENECSPKTNHPVHNRTHFMYRLNTNAGNGIRKRHGRRQESTESQGN